MRVRWQLVDQHRQRLLRRPAVLAVQLGSGRRPAVRLPRRPGHQGPADSGRREAARHAGPRRLGLRLGRRPDRGRPVARHQPRRLLHPGQEHLCQEHSGQERSGEEGRQAGQALRLRLAAALRPQGRLHRRLRRHPVRYRQEPPRVRRLAQALRAEQGQRQGRRPDLPGPAPAPRLTARRNLTDRPGTRHAPGAPRARPVFRLRGRAGNRYGRPRRLGSSRKRREDII
ncbi:hypothetical protein SBRY_30076 [Actinacidiphila bryophytorum]|uniref:Uncharacterized protein n=1 Tax=Actinacidiphila bryophytorum TaxID=1436133 RepID=A0A9W4M8V0_9ACTN|nr:hypothetical protein SBRY_30076 [Actinacidiphila bryophytorum]